MTEAETRSVEEVEERLRWALADLDNLRKRVAREVARERDTERERVLSAWLPVLDNLELALAHAAEDNPLVEGLRAVREQAVAVLERLGYPRFDDLGEPFDPSRHEAVTAVPGGEDTPAGSIVATTRAGYGRHGTLLRPASVVVARPPEDSGPGPRTEG
jgi:molecular chaperone GrpE